MSKNHIQTYLIESLGCLWANPCIILANPSDIQATCTAINLNYYTL